MMTRCGSKLRDDLRLCREGDMRYIRGPDLEFGEGGTIGKYDTTYCGGQLLEAWKKNSVFEQTRILTRIIPIHAP